MLVGQGMLAVIEATALDQPGQTGVLVPKLGQRCGGVWILGLQHFVEGDDVHCFPALLDGRVPVGVGTQLPLAALPLLLVVPPPEDLGLTCSNQLAGRQPRKPSNVFVCVCWSSMSKGGKVGVLPSLRCKR